MRCVLTKELIVRIPGADPRFRGRYPRRLYGKQWLGGPDRIRTRVTTLHHERVIRIPIAGRDDWEQPARELA